MRNFDCDDSESVILSDNQCITPVSVMPGFSFMAGHYWARNLYVVIGQKTCSNFFTVVSDSGQLCVRIINVGEHCYR